MALATDQPNDSYVPQSLPFKPYFHRYTVGDEQYNTEPFLLSRKGIVSFSSWEIIPRVYSPRDPFYLEKYKTRNSFFVAFLCKRDAC